MILYDSLSKFGNSVDDALKIEKSFSLSSVGRRGSGCMILDMLAYYEGENAPKIKFEFTAVGENTPFYSSHSYSVGRKGEYTRKSWRIPPVFSSEINLTISLELPDGTVLYVKDAGISGDGGSSAQNFGPRHNAHLGFWGLAPDNTMPAFELAAASGFRYCIVVPKVTKDGRLVCIHDDTINRTARDSDGKAPEDKIFVWDKTYDELMEWEYGSYKNKVYKGTKLPLLSDFFDLCVRTGMQPMFSTHPALTVEQWKEVKEMLSRRNLLKVFHVKSFDIEVLKTAYSIFGADIDGYTYDVGGWNGTHVDKMLCSGIDKNACRCGVEVQFDEYTEEIADSIRAAGFFASAWNIKRRDFAEYEKLISWGVSEFTEDCHCSMGLNY